MALDRIDLILSLQTKWKWVSYLLAPVLLILRIYGIAACMFTGAVLIDWKIPYKEFFKLVVHATSVILIGEIFKTLVLLFTDINNLDDLLYKTDWFSLLGWLGKGYLPAIAIIPASFLNVFEILFCMLLISGIYRLSNQSRGAFFVFSTYGIGIILCCLISMYLWVNFIS